MFKLVCCFVLFTGGASWIRISDYDNGHDDYDRYDRVGIYHPMFGDTLLDRLIRAREALHSMHLRDADIIHASTPVRVPLSFRIADEVFDPNAQLDKFIQISFVLILIMSGIAAFYIIKNRTEMLNKSKELCKTTRILQPIEGTYDSPI